MGLPIVSSGPVLPALCSKVDIYINLSGKGSTFTGKDVISRSVAERILLHIKDKDCVAMEVRYHKSCYCQLTRFLTKSTATVTGTTEEEM